MIFRKTNCGGYEHNAGFVQLAPVKGRGSRFLKSLSVLRDQKGGKGSKENKVLIKRWDAGRVQPRLDLQDETLSLCLRINMKCRG